MVAATRLDCVLGSASLMRRSLAEASWHVAHRSAFGGLLADKPLMQNVIADLAVESEAATALAIRLAAAVDRPNRSEEHTSELQSLMRTSYAVFCLKKKQKNTTHKPQIYHNMPEITT